MEMSAFSECFLFSFRLFRTNRQNRGREEGDLPQNYDTVKTGILTSDFSTYSTSEVIPLSPRKPLMLDIR